MREKKQGEFVSFFIIWLSWTVLFGLMINFLTAWTDSYGTHAYISLNFKIHNWIDRNILEVGNVTYFILDIAISLLVVTISVYTYRIIRQLSLQKAREISRIFMWIFIVLFAVNLVFQIIAPKIIDVPEQIAALETQVLDMEQELSKLNQTKYATTATETLPKYIERAKKEIDYLENYNYSISNIILNAVIFDGFVMAIMWFYLKNRLTSISTVD